MVEVELYLYVLVCTTYTKICLTAALPLALRALCVNRFAAFGGPSFQALLAKYLCEREGYYITCSAAVDFSGTV